MMEFGGFWRRFFALICDSFVAAIPAFLVVAVLVKSGFDITGIAVNLATFVVFIGYFVVLQSSTLQTTIGKALLGLKVSTVNGERASALRILGRELAKIVSAIPLYIGFLLAAFTGRKQALHDMIASTVVQKVGPAKPLKGAIVVVVAAVVLGGVVNTLLGDEFEKLEKATLTAQRGEVAAPPAAKPVPKPQPVQAKPAPVAAKPAPVAAKPAPEAKPAPVAVKPAPVAAKPAPEAKPVPIAATVVVSTSKPVQVAQAPAPAKPAAQEPAKPVVKEAPKPMAAEPPKEETPKPAAAAPKPEPMPVQAIPAGPVIPGPKFNDLVTAVLYRDAVAVDELITFGKWPDRPDSRGMTPLMLAAMLGDAPIAEALLKAGANPNHPAPGGHTAMSIARERKDSGMEALLQRHGAR